MGNSNDCSHETLGTFFCSLSFPKFRVLKNELVCPFHHIGCSLWFSRMTGKRQTAPTLRRYRFSHPANRHLRHLFLCRGFSVFA